MINWIIILLGFTFWLEGTLALKNWLRLTDLRYRIYISRSSRLKRLQYRSKADQLEYIAIKHNLKKYTGNFWIKLTYHIVSFIFLGGLIYDGLNIYFIVSVVAVFILIGSLNYKNRLFGFFSEFYLYHFVLLYIVLTMNVPFTFMGFNIGLLYMLPFFLVYKIIYTNIRARVLK